MNELEVAAQQHLQTLNVKKSLKDLIFENFIKGEEVLKKYSKDELNKKMLDTKQDDQLTSQAIKKDEYYFVTENSLELMPTTNSHCGLYRFHTYLDFKTKKIDDGFLITAIYKTQRDHSNQIYTGRELVLRYINGKFYGASDNHNLNEWFFKGFQILKNGYSYLAIKGNKVVATFQNSVLKKGKKSTLKMKDFIYFLKDLFNAENNKDNKYNYQYIVAVNDDRDYELLLSNTHTLRMDSLEKVLDPLPERVEELQMTSCNHENVEILETKKLSLTTPRNFSFSKIIFKNQLKELSLHETDIKKINLSEYPNLEFLFITGRNEKSDIIKNLELPIIKRVIFDNVWVIIKSLPKEFFNFNYDTQTWFGYSNTFFSIQLEADKWGWKKGSTEHIRLAYKDNNFYRLYQGDHDYKIIAKDKLYGEAKEWAENIGNPAYYVSKLKKELIDAVFSYRGHVRIEPGTYHTSDDLSKCKLYDIIECKIGDNVDKYLITAMHLDNSTISVVPFEKRFIHTNKDIHQITYTSRMEDLMIDLFDINKIPYRGWKNKKIKVLKAIGKLTKDDIKKELLVITEKNIFTILDEISLTKFMDRYKTNEKWINFKEEERYRDEDESENKKRERKIKIGVLKKYLKF